MLSICCPISHSAILSRRLSLSIIAATNHFRFRSSAMSVHMKFHAFAGSNLRSKAPKSIDRTPTSALEALKHSLLATELSPPGADCGKILLFRNGRPLVGCRDEGDDGASVWGLEWLSMVECRELLGDSRVPVNERPIVYLGVDGESVMWGVDVSDHDGLGKELGKRSLCFVELRTLMVATDWTNVSVMQQLAVAGQGRALLEWSLVSQYCGHCGAKTIPVEAGRKKQCSNEVCKKRIYPRVDTVVIMLVIDRENDRALLSRQSRFVPRMWSCLAGFIEPGESLEEAVRRETWEEAGVEVGDVVYHSSQPWPVGPSSMPCQLMVGFFAYAKSLEINVDKSELEDAQWHKREDVKKALTFAEYKKAQTTTSSKIEQMCKGVEKAKSLTSDYNVESGELAPMFIPGPYAIAHHLISSWVHQDAPQTDPSSSE
uniref:NAD(+) diphosphatase n=1 Tax=Kalanchoe fedtschenkoi TaxID=63787 RepID=A0A7N0T7W8_KALFE